MRGLEILGVGLIDANNKDCISLFVVQTPPSQILRMAKWTLVDRYLFVLEKKKDAPQKLTSNVVAAAWFTKLPNVKAVIWVSSEKKSHKLYFPRIQVCLRRMLLKHTVQDLRLSSISGMQNSMQVFVTLKAGILTD